MMLARIPGVTVVMTLFGCAPSVFGQDLMVEKKVFELPRYTTVANATIRNVRVGWEAAGRSMLTNPTRS